MKSRAREFLDRSIAAMLAAIEAYNKPSAHYRAESFAILAINAWELLFKAKMLHDNGNNIRVLYCYESRQGKSGKIKKSKNVKRTPSGAPFTHSVEYLTKVFSDKKIVHSSVRDNILLLLEFRNASIHFYSQTLELRQRIQELGMATLKNYVNLLNDWFDKRLSEYDIFLIPLAFVNVPSQYDSTVTQEERAFLEHLLTISKTDSDPDSPFSVTVNIQVKFARTKDPEAFRVALSPDEEAIPIVLSEEQIRDKYPLSYGELTKRLCGRYRDFKQDTKYHSVRKKLQENPRFGHIRRLDPSNPKSNAKPFFSEAIIPEFDKHYTLV